ncbi:MAG TPA: response regulator transcription factor [Chloroflexota bacterium]|jgi:DNA-binding response OmpR family regulator
MRLLLIEDDRRLSHTLGLSLSEEGYAVDRAYDGVEGQELAEALGYDAIILDLLLPRKDGLEVCRTLRQRRVIAPILILTARDAVADRVRGLDSGADDYLVKPFALHELLARLRALLRRTSPQKDAMLAAGDLSLDPATRHVARAGRRIVLTTREFTLLEYFLRHQGQVLTRAQIETHLWGYDYEGASNVIDVCVRRLRRKIDDPFAAKMVETLYGAGYRLRVLDNDERGAR